MGLLSNCSEDSPELCKPKPTQEPSEEKPTDGKPTGQKPTPTPPKTAIHFRIRTEKGWNYIDKEGTKLFSEDLFSATDFVNGYATVASNEGVKRTEYYKEAYQPIEDYKTNLGTKYGTFGLDKNNKALPAHIRTLKGNYNEPTLLTGYQKGDPIKEPYWTGLENYGVFVRPYEALRFFEKKTGKEITQSSSVLYTIQNQKYITVPYYTLDTSTSKPTKRIIDTKGATQFKEVEGALVHFSEGYALFDKTPEADESQLYFISPENKKLNNKYYAFARPFSEGIAWVKETLSGDWVALDKGGNVAFNTNYDRVTDFTNGYTIAYNSSKAVVLDKTGKLAFNRNFKTFNGGVHSGLMAIQVPEQAKPNWLYINTNGETAFPTSLKFFRARPFHQGLAAVQVKEQFDSPERYRYLNAEGKFINDITYHHAENFSEGLAAVRQVHGGDYGYINKEGTMQIQPQFSSASRFNGGIAQVSFSDQEWGYINKEGKVLWRSSIRLD